MIEENNKEKSDCIKDQSVGSEEKENQPIRPSRSQSSSQDMSSKTPSTEPETDSSQFTFNQNTTFETSTKISEGPLVQDEEAPQQRPLRKRRASSTTSNQPPPPPLSRPPPLPLL